MLVWPLPRPSNDQHESLRGTERIRSPNTTAQLMLFWPINTPVSLFPPPPLSPRSSLPLALSKKMAPPPAPGAEADNHDLGAAFADDAAMDFLNEVEKLAEDEKGARSAGVR